MNYYAESSRDIQLSAIKAIQSKSRPEMTTWV